MDHLINPIVFFNNQTQTAHLENKEDDKSNIGINFNFFRSDDAKMKNEISDPPVQKKRSRKTVNKIETVDKADKPAQPTSYSDSYSEMNAMLRGTIAQTDQLSIEVKEDIDTIRASKTIKNKYTYITNLTSSIATVLRTKVDAIKEMDSNITQAHNLDIKRETMMKNNADDNDDMRMMDLYSAFINTPMGTYTPPSTVPNIQDSILGVNSGLVNATSMIGERQDPLSPESIAMRLETNPNIIQVVKYDSTTGQRFFDVIDKSTGQSVPNVPRPDNFLLDDTVIDVHTGTARNRNLDKVWPLIDMNNPNGVINEY